tara:strand:+ start:22611 stop:23234 length:624 start_codon:yes stop_codon:yes gene_type:complete
MLNDHPIFLESVEFIRSKLGSHNFNNLEVQVLERLIHASGDFSIKHLLQFSENACEISIKACKSGAPIITDTEMAAVAIKAMAKNTHGNLVVSIRQWLTQSKKYSSTSSAYCMEKAWLDISKNYFGDTAPIVLVGSAPTALEKLLDILEKSVKQPSLIVGMPVGFIGVERSKQRLMETEYNYIIMSSTRGGASMVAATMNALLRSSI